ncbi:MAG: c-type cytochrome [Hyphomicrobiaceae bacterium]|nr:MAG: c-type cytochrome [Hyphomicrobiaceae bacterium]
MKRLTAIAACLAVAGAAVAIAGSQGRNAVEPAAFSADEREAILSHGPWPPPMPPDPSNRVSGNSDAIALGRWLFSDKRLSADGARSCATCHDPAKAFTDGRDRSIGLVRVDRNAIALANLRLNRWYGWAGAADSLWAQSIRPILDPKEFAATPELVRARLAADAAIRAAYARVFAAEMSRDPPERVLVNLAKALAAYQETIVTARTPFDDFRDALARGDTATLAHYPLAAQKGLKIFVGKGRCTACHLGPNFTSGEFEDVGVPYFVEAHRVDAGRFAGIAELRRSSFSLAGPHNDDAVRADAAPTRHVEQLHRNWGEFRVPSLRNVAATAPYMHNGSLATLEDVVRHYSQVDEERLHGTEGQRLLRPLHLTREEASDLVAFLKTLSSAVVSQR